MESPRLLGVGTGSHTRSPSVSMRRSDAARGGWRRQWGANKKPAPDWEKGAGELTVRARPPEGSSGADRAPGWRRRCDSAAAARRCFADFSEIKDASRNGGVSCPRRLSGERKSAPVWRGAFCTRVAEELCADVSGKLDR